MDYVCSDNDSSDVKLSEEGAQQEDKVHKVTGEEVKSERSPTYDGVQGNTWDGSDPFPGEDNQPYQPQWGAEDETSSDGVTMATDNDASDTFVNQDREQYWQKPTEYQDEFVLILNTDSKPKGCPVETIMQSYGMYKVIWNGHHDELRNILNWFRFELKPGDENSVIEFPPTLPKEERQTIHILLHSLKLGGHSYFNGVNNQKVLKVYTSDLVCKRNYKS
ncbi:uncharacterized protein LOC102807581 [Saccoglossus kowalevskii]|uniref:Uncharacterized protein LOC102807581 n=1 Tax=Saccoglossus kowalevskii TaxID=10224 RepID=A0ABM0MM89_SACKO|nr:PREDICTED: uncharacterized protein LOC102807581 [Saccoglossus kowalevskii]